ncbi:RPA-interacting protein A-like [Frankliniella occidentalis]|uniref:RPA-interacting protein A-like n=1 Tax=Frankliniella occidentalis TaxID=133901 RepID=A0A6J1TDC1_FRAOC|nr:RPA-interacting protein A-like [Frankliniella occidentalis]
MESGSFTSAGIIISPSTHQKIRSRNAAMRLKHGVPQFKDVLRKRFLSRIKESRGRLLDKFRDVGATHNDTVFKAIQQEVSNILDTEDFVEMDVEDETRYREEVESETLLELENWLMQQYDLLMADDNTLQQLWEETLRVVCPVCLKGNLISNVFANTIHCENCPITLPARASLSDIRDRIYTIVTHHSESGCSSQTLFFLSQEDSSLYAHCNVCPYLDLAV